MQNERTRIVNTTSNSKVFQNDGLLMSSFLSSYQTSEEGCIHEKFRHKMFVHNPFQLVWSNDSLSRQFRFMIILRYCRLMTFLLLVEESIRRRREEQK